MRLGSAFFMLVCFVAAAAQAQNRIPMNVGDKNTFKAVNLKQGQCSVTMSDTETGWQPEVDLEALKSNFGTFAGSTYLSQWNNNHADKEFIISVNYFEDETDRKVLQTEVYLNYGKKFDDNDIKKHLRTVIFFDESFKVTDFMEKLKIEKPGHRHESNLISVPQEVSVKDQKVSFVRLTTNGIKLSVTCDLGK